MNRESKSPWPIFAVLVALMIGTTLAWRATLGFRAFTWESYRRLSVLQHPLAMPMLQLQDQDGRIFTPTLYEGKVLLVNFIYTRCPSLCTYSGTVYGRLLAALANDERRSQVRLLSISLDPDHDTPERMREYRRRYIRASTESWRVARPLSAQAGAGLLARFGVVSIPDGLGGIKHNAAIHLIDRHGQLVRIISETDTVDILSAVDALYRK